ncbi:unnamed protein product [Paramecium sonneborni]|uniref:Uncharacterized protein n=1 Tax=Paramecium sonneborni TaxID=65129 RepID=A0A8S1MTQ1_9CILI|nr:unnamed protein product [Paramecium sonneborni]
MFYKWNDIINILIRNHHQNNEYLCIDIQKLILLYLVIQQMDNLYINLFLIYHNQHKIIFTLTYRILYSKFNICLIT